MEVETYHNFAVNGIFVHNSEEDIQGTQFCGKSGELLEEALRKLGVDMRQDCWLTNALICRPPRNRTPTDKELEYCLPNLVRCVKELQPEVIIPLGAKAVKALIGWLWKSDVGAMGRWDGWRIPVQSINAWVCPTWHPAHILRNGDEHKGRHGYGTDREQPLQKLFWEPRLKAAFELEGRPWKILPDYKGRIVSIIEPSDAGVLIREFFIDKVKGPVAFDFETNMLKPDSADAEIMTCAIANKDQAIAFPWHGEAIKAMRDLLFSSIPKIGFNIKFEERWLLKEFGQGVNNWIWDGMLATHTLDNRRGICGLEFQAFVLLGQAPWDSAVAPYLKSDRPNKPNRIREIDLRKLLEYNAMDAILEFEVAKAQRRQFK